jgi:hypothetical protein
MPHFKITLNQLATYSNGTAAKKRSILKRQMQPDKLLIPWYQKAKGSIKDFMRAPNDPRPLDKAIAELQRRIPRNNRQRIDHEVSIQALQIVRDLQLPDYLIKANLRPIKATDSVLTIEGVDIRVSPDVIFRIEDQGKVIIGAVKIHISKSEPFDYEQAQIVAATLQKYLVMNVASDEEIVPHEYCLCIDVFSKRIVSAPHTSRTIMRKIKNLCRELAKEWPTS